MADGDHANLPNVGPMAVCYLGPLPVCKGQDFLAEDGTDVIVSGRESIITESDVRCVDLCGIGSASGG